MCLEVEQYEVSNLYLIFGSGGKKRSELVVWSRRERFRREVREANEVNEVKKERRRMESDAEQAGIMSVFLRVDLE